MASFKEAFAAARKDGKESFSWNGGTYNTSVKKSDNSRYESGALKGMRRDPNEGETMEERRKRLVEKEKKLMASRPKAPAPKPAEPKPSEAKGSKPPVDYFAAMRAADEGYKAHQRQQAAGAVKEVKQVPGRVVEGGMRAAGAPAHARIFAGTLLGNRQKITEADFDKDEQEQLRRAAKRATSKGRKGDIQYEDYDAPLKRGSLSRDQAAAQTVGRTGKGKTTREGKGYRLRDKMDYSNEDRDKEIARYERMGGFRKAATVVGETVRDVKDKGVKEAVKRVPSRLANAYIGRDGREVDIKLARGGGIESKGRTKGKFV